MKGTHGPCQWCGEPDPYDTLIELGIAKGPPICRQCKIDFAIRVMSGISQMDDTFKERVHGQRDQIHADVDSLRSG